MTDHFSFQVYRLVFISRKEILVTPPQGPAAKDDGKKSATATPEKEDKKSEDLKLTPGRTTRSASKATKDDSKPTPEKPKVVAMEVDEDHQAARVEFEEKFGDLIEFYNLVSQQDLSFSLELSLWSSGALSL